MEDKKCPHYGTCKWINKVLCDQCEINKAEAKEINDSVNHPAHYTRGKIECIDFIQDQELNFCRGNAIKYIVRAGFKDPEKEVEDLKKAVFYLKSEIKNLIGDEENERSEN